MPRREALALAAISVLMQQNTWCVHDGLGCQCLPRLAGSCAPKQQQHLVQEVLKPGPVTC